MATDALKSVAIEKHKKGMKTVHPSDPLVLDAIASEVGRLTESFERSIDMDAWIRSVSTSSCVERSRRQGGTYEFFQDGEDDGKKRASQIISVSSPIPLPPKPKIRFFDVTEEGVSTYVTSCPYSISEAIEIQNRLLENIPHGRPLRKVVAIAEPLKFRIVTVHHAPESLIFEQAAKNLQSFLSRTRECLSGKVVDDSSWSGLREVFDEMTSLDLDPVIVSDDASAATDSIAHSLLMKVAPWLLPESLLPIFHRLSKGMLKYEDNDEIDQVTGQLMGARWSFGFLCAIHMAAKRSFLSEYCVPRRLHFFRVNGDDGVIVLPRFLLETYFSYMGNLWVINRQKTMVSTVAFLFNSQMRYLKDYTEVPKIRFNLIAGVTKYGNSYQVPSVLNCALSSVPKKYEDHIWEWSMASRHWQKTLSELSRKSPSANWCLPYHLGGLGINRSWGKFEISSRQMRQVDWWLSGDIDRINHHRTRVQNSAKVLNCLSMSRRIPCVDSEVISRAVTPIGVKEKASEETGDLSLKVRPLPRERLCLSNDEYYERHFTMRLISKLRGVGDEDIFSLISQHISNHEAKANTTRTCGESHEGPPEGGVGSDQR
jgi:hypothetical protein